MRVGKEKMRATRLKRGVEASWRVSLRSVSNWGPRQRKWREWRGTKRIARKEMKEVVAWDDLFSFSLFFFYIPIQGRLRHARESRSALWEWNVVK